MTRRKSADGRRAHPTWQALIVCACHVICSSGLAANADEAIRRSTDVPRQALASALKTLIREYDIQLVYRAELVRDRMTDGVRGELTAIEALDADPEKGTGLTTDSSASAC